MYWNMENIFLLLVMKSKVLSDVRRKRWFVSKSELKRIERKKAIRRIRKNQRMSG